LPFISESIAPSFSHASAAPEESGTDEDPGSDTEEDDSCTDEDSGGSSPLDDDESSQAASVKTSPKAAKAAISDKKAHFFAINFIMVPLFYNHSIVTYKFSCPTNHKKKNKAIFKTCS
jgi:hypothetical protein